MALAGMVEYAISKKEQVMPADVVNVLKACHCSIVFLRRTRHLFHSLKSFIVTTFPTRQIWTGIAPPYSFS